MFRAKSIKNKLVYVILFFTIILGYYFSIYSTSDIPTMTKPDDSNYIRKDLNGDGKEDVIYIVSKDNKYYLEALIDNQTYFFNEKRPLNTLGEYYDHSPISIHFADLSRNKLPEIIIQAKESDTSIQHIFTFYNNEFKDIFCSTNNILGVIDSNNSKTPKYISCNSSNIEESLTKNMLISDKPKNISYENINIKFLYETLSFLNTLIEEKSINFDVLSENIHKEAASKLNVFLDTSNSYSLTDIFFIDTEWDKNSNPSHYNISVRYKKTDSKNLESLVKLNLEVSYINDKFSILSVY